MAAKCVGLGKICVFRYESYIGIVYIIIIIGLSRAQFKDLTDQTKYYDVEVLAQFGWQKTDNFYMNIGGSTHLGLMGCGDDQGYTWVYKLPAWLAADDSHQPQALPQSILPIGIE